MQCRFAEISAEPGVRLAQSRAVRLRAGKNDTEKSLTMSLYNLFKCTNPEINVLLNRDDTELKCTSCPTTGVSLRFGTPLSDSRGKVGWSVANKLSNTARSSTGDIQLNKTGKAVKFIGDLYKLLNR